MRFYAYAQFIVYFQIKAFLEIRGIFNSMLLCFDLLNRETDPDAD